MFFMLISNSCSVALLWACQIYQLKFAYCNFFYVIFVDWLNSYCENAMRSRRCLVQIMRGNNSVPYSIVIKFQHLLLTLTFKNVKILNLKLILLTPSDSQPWIILACWSWMWIIQQVKHFFVVNLQKWAKDCNMLVLRFLVSLAKHIIYDSRDDSKILLWVWIHHWHIQIRLLTFQNVIVALHGESFARSSLSVGKDSWMIALKLPFKIIFQLLLKHFVPCFSSSIPRRHLVESAVQ